MANGRGASSKQCAKDGGLTLWRCQPLSFGEWIPRNHRPARRPLRCTAHLHTSHASARAKARRDCAPRWLEAGDTGMIMADPFFGGHCAEDQGNGAEWGRNG